MNKMLFLEFLVNAARIFLSWDSHQGKALRVLVNLLDKRFIKAKKERDAWQRHMKYF